MLSEPLPPRRRPKNALRYVGSDITQNPLPPSYCESAPSGPFFGEQRRKLAPEDATAVVVVEKFGAVNPGRRSLVEKCRRRHRQERRHEIEPPAAPGSTEKIGDGGQGRVHVCAGKRGFNCHEECNEQGDAPRGWRAQ